LLAGGRIFNGKALGFLKLINTGKTAVPHFPEGNPNIIQNFLKSLQ